jgi:hypothetical protein
MRARLHGLVWLQKVLPADVGTRFGRARLGRRGKGGEQVAPTLKSAAFGLGAQRGA